MAKAKLKHVIAVIRDQNPKRAALPLTRKKAMASLLGGESVRKSAKSAGVGAATVYRWIKSDPAFKPCVVPDID